MSIIQKIITGTTVDSIVSDITGKISELRAHAKSRLEKAGYARDAAAELQAEAEGHTAEAEKAERWAQNFEKLFA